MTYRIFMIYDIYNILLFFNQRLPLGVKQKIIKTAQGIPITANPISAPIIYSPFFYSLKIILLLKLKLML